MGKNENTPQTVTVNDIDYAVEDLTEKQIALINHVNDLDRKLNSARFNLDQLQGGRMFFMSQLEASLAAEPEEKAA